MAPIDPAEESNEDAPAAGPPVITERDIVFNCESCGGELVVDCEGEGIEVLCSHCGHPLIIPRYQPRPMNEPPETASAEAAPAESAPSVPEPRFDFTGFSPDQLGRRLEELRHQLKENRSQDTELRGHVNRATMELHRLHLKAQKLQDRHFEIEAEIAAARRAGQGEL